MSATSVPCRYVNLGRSGLKVSNLSLGTLNFGWTTDEAESIRLIHQAIDAGINLLDGADYYNGGRSEEIIGKAINGRRDRVVICSKVFWPTGAGPNDRGTSRYHLLQSVETSLRRLDTDHIDLLLLHRPDPETPVEESLRTLDDLIRAGKVRYAGVSEFKAWQVAEALWTCDRLLMGPVTVTETHYNLLHREPEAELVPLAQKYGVGMLVYGALAFGMLTGKYRPGEPFPEGSRGALRQWAADSPRLQQALTRAARLAELAREWRLEPVPMALAWLLQQPGVTSVILGPRTEAHLADHLKALDLELPPDLLKAIDEISPPAGQG